MYSNYGVTEKGSLAGCDPVQLPDVNGADEPQGLSCCKRVLFCTVFPGSASISTHCFKKRESSSKEKSQKAVERLRARYKSHWVFAGMYLFELAHAELSTPSLSMQGNKI